MTSEQPTFLSRVKSSCLFFVLLTFFFIVGLVFVTATLSQMGGEQSGVIERSEGNVDPQSSAIASISLSGVMLRDSEGVDQGITSDLLLMLRKARKDEKIKGVLLRLNTPGGSVTDADLVYHELKKLNKAGKPVLLLMDDTCASGGYYAALAAQEVWALPTTITGSIGVIVSSLNFSKLLSNYGVVDQSVTSGPNKALFSPTSAPNPAHRAIMQRIVNQLYQRFLKLLIEGRKIEEDVAHTIADGRVFTATEALKYQLIDQIGYPDDALRRIRKLSGLSAQSRVVKYDVPRNFFSRFSSQLGVTWSTWRSGRELSELALKGPRAYYLYAPDGALWRALQLVHLK